MAIAAPAIAGVRMAHAQSAPVADRATTDLVFEQIRRQLIASRQKAGASGGMTAEDAAACAAVLRVAAAHTREIGLDRSAMAALQAVLDERGDVKTPRLGAGPLAALAQRGIDVPPRLRDAPHETDARARRGVIERILSGQASTEFERLAMTFDSNAPRLAHGASTGPGVVRVGQEYGFCLLLAMEVLMCWYFAAYFTGLAEASAEFWPLALNFWEALLVLNGLLGDLCNG